MAIEIAETLAQQVADPDTHFLGEVYLNVDDNGDGVSDRRVNAVATPHLWAGMLVYLTAMAYYSPQSFDRYEAALPAVDIPLDQPSGCGCTSGPAWWGQCALLAAALRVRRRRRRASGSAARSTV